MGFCVGGLLTWLTGLRTPDLAAIVPWYGAGFDPTEAEIAGLQAPVLDFYGKKDQSIPQAQVEKIERMLKAAHKEAEVRVYPDAGHAFLNPAHGMGHDSSARDAWDRAVRFLKDHAR